MASSTGNGSANGFASHEPESSTTQQSRRRMFNDTAEMNGNGGLGRGSYTPHHTQNSSQAPALQSSDINSAIDFYEQQFLPKHDRSLSGIALRAFLLGSSLTFSTVLTLYFLYQNIAFWRGSFFITLLSLFHFLEFYTTALTNTGDAKVSSFLLSSNGSAYTIAHLSAFMECLVSHLFLPRFLPSYVHYSLLFLGLFLVTVGQLCRSLAMIEAGSNFSHMIKRTKSPTHMLITTGIYSFLRHPSYFGFFWWGIGTQLVCGNTICLAGYAYVLWTFFNRRIDGEERLLVEFFGEEYVDYRKRTVIGIPLI